MELSIILPVLNEEGNITIILRSVQEVLRTLAISYEILVVDGGSKDRTVELAQREGSTVRLIYQQKKGYGEALRAGFQESMGDYVITLDGDLSHDPQLILTLWAERLTNDVVIGSRYVPGGTVRMPLWRLFLSKVLNIIFTFFLQIPVCDLSSGFRLYRSLVIRTLQFESTNFEALEEILIKAFLQGRRIREVPMHFSPRKMGKSKVKLLEFAVSFTKAFLKMFWLRYFNKPEAPVKQPEDVNASF
ncbi:MAG: glycosyltransferase [Candidatus Omnitrophica bacterium]|nr:glycosyltransferase [Candidatus Omnitrophota bacterium]